MRLHDPEIATGARSAPILLRLGHNRANQANPTSTGHNWHGEAWLMCCLAQRDLHGRERPFYNASRAPFVSKGREQVYQGGVARFLDRFAPWTSAFRPMTA
jgi:hypothetical protein